MLRNAITYLGWSVNFLYPTVPGYSDAVDPRYFRWGLVSNPRVLSLCDLWRGW